MLGVLILEICRLFVYCESWKWFDSDGIELLKIYSESSIVPASIGGCFEYKITITAFVLSKRNSGISVFA